MRASRPTVAWVVAAVRFGRSFSVVCRGGPWPSRETLRHRGVPGTISGLRAGPYGPVGLRNAPAGAVQASSPTEVCGAAGARFFRVGRGPSVGRRGGIYPARGRLCRRGVRRDEGIPPYGRPESGSRSLWAGHIRKVCRGGPWPSRGTLRRRGVRGTMRALSPTEVCCNAGPRFPGWPRHSPSSVGVDSISARGRLCRRGVRRDEGIPPYGRPGGYSRSGLV